MANEKNLKPKKTLSSDEAKRLGSAGGRASGEARRNKKLLKDCMLDLLALPVANAKEWNKLSKLGIDVENIDNRALLTAALFRRAVETGDVAAFKAIKSLIGEDVTPNDEQLRKLDEVLSKIKGVV